jgi:hypothetical protein
MPVASSTSGYITEIGDAQVRHRPRNATQLMTGTFSNHASPRLQFVQRDAGHTIDSRRGSL